MAEYQCEYCKFPLEFKTKDPTKCNQVGVLGYPRCHNCCTWGPSGDGDNPWYEKKPCIGCKTRLLDGSFQAADKWKAKANEMKAKLAPAEKKKKENEERAKLAVRIHAGPV
eukprot:CAMPEP_0181310200 /NCGR_PEP_ID=MMETSP1101-20121128/12457_1 /TAXON_ID=46948 /ORGANISM="Rhodomonas abbreviata, Strain Caron Lab Isolate" /LENGTH=110 /DNA_ID=CAMNT_0023416809 /DNA_START=242 /DNA_END=574 /DNA_ORIENTATION=+